MNRGACIQFFLGQLSTANHQPSTVNRQLKSVLFFVQNGTSLERFSNVFLSKVARNISLEAGKLASIDLKKSYCPIAKISH